MARTRLGRCAGALAVLLGTTVTTSGEVLRIAAPIGAELEGEVLISRWLESSRVEILARTRLPGRVELPAGDYALRLSGTDHAYGPVHLEGAVEEYLELASLEAVAPGPCAPAVLFALDRETGALAARFAANGGPVVLVPGEFVLVRDLGELEIPIDLGPGSSRTVELGAVRIDCPGDGVDGLYFLLDDEGRAALFSRLSLGPSPVFPGRYRFQRQGSAVASAPIEVAAGGTATLALAALRIRSIGGAAPEYGVFALPDLAPALRASAGGKIEALLPGLYGLAPWHEIEGAGDAGVAAIAAAAPRFLAEPGVTTTFWVSPSGEILGGPGGGGLPVAASAPPGSHLVVGEPVTLSIGIAEEATVRLAVRALDGTPLRDLGEHAMAPSRRGVEVVLPADLADETPIAFEAQVALAEGSLLRGRSEPYLAAIPRTGRAPRLEVQSATATSVVLLWTPADGPDVAGYEIYRFPLGDRPLQGDLPLAALRYEDLGLSAGRTYRYVVRAVDSRGVGGPWSEEVVAVPGARR